MASRRAVYEFAPPRAVSRRLGYETPGRAAKIRRMKPSSVFFTLFVAALALMVSNSGCKSDSESAPGNPAPFSAAVAEHKAVNTVASNSTWTDPFTGLTWEKKDNHDNADWKEAMSYCRKLRLDGYDDWRLPSIDELNAIYDTRAIVANEAGEKYHVKGNLRLSGWEWSSTNSDEHHAWMFGFWSGIRQLEESSGVIGDRAVCVRGS